MRIEARGITIRLGGATILDDVGVTVRGGEIVGLIGPNGAGKTTLLRALADLVAPVSGTVRYDGKSGAEFGRRALARNLAFLAQGIDVHWAVRVDDLVSLGRLPHRRFFAGPSAADRDAIEAAMTAAEVTHLRARTASTLSGGERMRALLARALTVEAKILLADEPTASLDPLHQLRIMRLLQATARAGTGVVVVLHDLMLASRFCDRLVLVKKGRILLDDHPSRLTDELLADAYGVVAFRGEHDGESLLVPWAPLPSREPARPTSG